MRRFALAVLFLAAFTAACSTADADERPHHRTPAPAVVAGSSADLGAALVYVGDVERVVSYIVWSEQRDQVVAYIMAITAQEEAARAAASVPVAPTTARSSNGHSDAWWMGVAQCEQGGRNDPYFGYFSFMDGSQGGKPWAEQVAAGNALLASAGSESPAWAPACVAAGYAASPGG